MIAPLLLASLLAAPAPFEPTGEVSFHVSGGGGTGASFSAERLVGPNANLTLTDGGWAGDIVGHDVQLEVSDRRITGAGIDLHLDRAGAKHSIRGNVFGQRVSFERAEREVNGRVGGCSFTLKRKGTGRFEGTVACIGPRGGLPQTGYGVLKLAGAADTTEPPSPQFPLALIAALL